MTMFTFMQDASEAELHELIWLVDQLADRKGIDWDWFVQWANGDPRSSQITAPPETHDDYAFTVPATALAIISWLAQYRQRGYI